MSNDESDLERLLGDGMERVRTALDATEDDELPDENAESVRETADAIADEVADASLDELLAATGFEDVSDDISPPDLPMLMQDADPDAVLGLRNLLEMADLSEEWSSLDAEERIDRLERIDGDETSSDSDRSVSDLLSSVLSTSDSSEEKASQEAEEGSEEEAESGDDETKGEETEAESEDDETKSEEERAESDETESGDDGAETESEKREDESSTVEETLTELRSLFDSAGVGGDDSTDEATAEATEETDEESDDDSGGSGHGSGGDGRGTAKVSTMPSARSDMGGSSRHSTMPDKH